MPGPEKGPINGFGGGHTSHLTSSCDPGLAALDPVLGSMSDKLSLKPFTGY